jgi:hypothetical protein
VIVGIVSYCLIRAVVALKLDSDNYPTAVQWIAGIIIAVF